MRYFLMAVLGLAMAVPAQAAEFSFVAYGDTAYTLPRDHGRNLALIDLINAERPAFAMHVGDFKGYTRCDDAAYRVQLERFARHDHPVVLTPGDNDWTDCWVPEAGGFEPLERLAALRRMFFAADQSLGGRSMPLVRQDGFPENARWSHEGVLFATIHAVGPHNNLVVRDRHLALESIDRTTAGEAWIRESFRAAREAGAPALVLAMHVDAWTNAAPVYEDGPLDWIRLAIREEAGNFQGQVLIVHGDSHRLVVDQPFRRADIEAGTTTGMNVTRLQVPGWPDHRAVRVEVDTSRPGIFGFSPILSAEERTGAPR